MMRLRKLMRLRLRLRAEAEEEEEAENGEGYMVLPPQNVAFMWVYLPKTLMSRDSTSRKLWFHAICHRGNVCFT